MISDVLSDAIGRIQEYLEGEVDEAEYIKCHRPGSPVWEPLQECLEKMERVRRMLDEQLSD